MSARERSTNKRATHLRNTGVNVGWNSQNVPDFSEVIASLRPPTITPCLFPPLSLPSLPLLLLLESYSFVDSTASNVPKVLSCAKDTRGTWLKGRENRCSSGCSRGTATGLPPTELSAPVFSPFASRNSPTTGFRSIIAQKDRQAVATSLR